ncbi:hypothetical protein [Plebeiibacterium marinum]|uniref:DNA polymerase III subunit gamma/tau n=1 Tax=Plebeiibacterium marinum TaxID=2992111 RepID=A0AAE3MDM1_9BACT|nr:hypothetical protein [Plebeiobacterium marinum]MCW3805931.1 hypothetical protein [Plebeiobacterium marinum]
MGNASAGTQSGGNKVTATSVTKTKPYKGGGKTEVKNPLKSISLKEALSGKSEVLKGEKTEETKEAVVEEEIDLSWNDPVTQDKVKDEWFNYMRQVQQSNQRLASIMKNHVPELQEGKVLYIRLKNVTQQKELNEARTQLFGYLRRQLRNAHLMLETEVVLGDDGGVKKAFTAAERAKLMAEKNPSLMLLTKKFDLDVEI